MHDSFYGGLGVVQNLLCMRGTKKLYFFKKAVKMCEGGCTGII